MDQIEFEDLVYEGIDQSSSVSGDEEVIFDQRELDELGLGDLSSRR